MYYVYIIYSKKLLSKYIGYTSDLKNRVNEHVQGKNRYTKKVDDWTLVYYEAFICKKDALSEEIFLKSGKGQERVKYLLQDYFLQGGEIA